MRILIAVTHLLGTGHLSRALTLGHGFVNAGHEVRLLSGGMPALQLKAEGVHVVQLPPVRSDGVQFTRLLDDTSKPVSGDQLRRRQEMISQEMDNFQPDALITELYPFGRRILSDEFQVLLNRAQGMRHKPAIFASIRDILAPPSAPEKAVLADAIIARFYDGVLVHADDSATPLSQSWPVSSALAEKLIYTGYVARAAAGEHPQKAGAGEVLVSAGGGSVGDDLFETVIAAVRISGATNWRLLVGGADQEARVTKFRQMSEGLEIEIEGVRPDFRQMLSHARCSVSMCGYNTALDILQAGCRAVFIPFDEGGEVEQTLRANSLSQRPEISTISSRTLTAESLLIAVENASLSDVADTSRIQFNGVMETVRIVSEKVVER